MKYIKLCLFIALVLSLNSCNDFKRHREISRILSEVEKDEEAHHKKTSVDGSESEQWKKIDSVMNIATVPELIHICSNHPSSTVRMAMFLHVVEKYPHEAIKIATKKANDFDTVDVLYGCKSYTTLVSCERFENLYGYKDFDKTFTNEERESLEKIVIQPAYFEHFVKNSSWIIDFIKPKPEYYQFLKDYYNKTKNKDVFLAILKYNNPNDRTMILDKLKQAIEELNNGNCYYFEAKNMGDILGWVAEHPENEFEPYVKQIMTTLFKLNTDVAIKAKKTDEFIITDEYHIGYSDLQALLAYKKKWAYDLLEAKIKEDIGEVTINIDDESEYFKPLTDRIKAAFQKQREEYFASR